MAVAPYIIAWTLGWWEVVLILILALLLFGARRLPEIARALGKSIKEFKRATKDIKDELNVDDDIEDHPEYRTKKPSNQTGNKPPAEEDDSSGN